MARILTFVPKVTRTPTPVTCGTHDRVPVHVWPPDAQTGSPCRCGSRRLPERLAFSQVGDRALSAEFVSA